ncbi:adenylate kinase 8 isoform X1 [Dendropsophus ebraccatus]|uniref:adenylate kinase 8 isoform X1 n=1 Tax=Dendropsophus ebraccatus TaxID=150705 RepID=UPI0038317A4C
MDATAKPLRIPPQMAVYAEEHHIFDIIQKMVQNLLIDRPEDPIQYLIDHLRRDNDDVPRIIILGPPASGKHTMAKLLCKRLNATHLTPENLLSSDVSALVEEALSYKGKDQEIPDTLWVRLIQERLSKVDCIKRVYRCQTRPRRSSHCIDQQACRDRLPSVKSPRNVPRRHNHRLPGEKTTYCSHCCGWVLEGFPQSREQGLLLQMNGTCSDHIVVLEAPDIVLIERNMGKRMDPSTGEVYHTTFDWPEDPEVQKNLVEPAGISEEETGKKLLEYHRNIPGILRAFPKKYKKINADQPCTDVLSQVLTFVLSKPRSLAPYTPRILLYGPPGSGRSFQAALLAQKYDVVNVSCGQVLKEAVADQTKIGLLIEPYIENEQQVPDNLVLRILSDRLSRLDCATRGWVLHGIPRDAEQAAVLSDAGYIPNRVFFLDIPDDVAIERLSLRMTDPVSGERYHSLYRPAPRVDVHQRLQQKPADAEQKVQMRLDMYHASAEELEEFYQDVIHVNADQDPFTVFEFIESCVVKPLPKGVPGELSSP